MSATRTDKRMLRTGAARLLAFGLCVGLCSLPAFGGDLHDPMRPPGVTKSTAKGPAGPTPIRLEAVMGNGERRVAIVNGKVVRAGDSLLGARIEEISANSIRYTRAGKEQVTTLPTSKLTVRTTNTLQAGQP